MLSCASIHPFTYHSFTRLILPAERVEAAAGAAQAGHDEGQQQHHGQDHAGDHEPGRELERRDDFRVYLLHEQCFEHTMQLALEFSQLMSNRHNVLCFQ